MSTIASSGQTTVISCLDCCILSLSNIFPLTMQQFILSPARYFQGSDYLLFTFVYLIPCTAPSRRWCSLNLTQTINNTSESGILFHNFRGPVTFVRHLDSQGIGRSHIDLTRADPTRNRPKVILHRPRGDPRAPHGSCTRRSAPGRFLLAFSPLAPPLPPNPPASPNCHPFPCSPRPAPASVSALLEASPAPPRVAWPIENSVLDYSADRRPRRSQRAEVKEPAVGAAVTPELFARAAGSFVVAGRRGRQAGLRYVLEPGSPGWGPDWGGTDRQGGGRRLALLPERRVEVVRQRGCQPPAPLSSPCEEEGAGRFLSPNSARPRAPHPQAGRGPPEHDGFVVVGLTRPLAPLRSCHCARCKNLFAKSECVAYFA